MAKKKDKKKPKKNHHKITLFLLKEDAPTDEECITEAPTYSEGFTIDGNNAQLFLFRSKTKRPRWFGLIESALGHDASKQFTSSGRISGLLFFSIGKDKITRRFAIALGHGAHRLDDSVYETDFGRNSTLVLADTDKLVSVDEQKFKDQIWHVKNQASQAAGAATFNFDPYSVVTRITAFAKDIALGKRITGAEAFVTTLPIIAEDIPRLSENILSAYTSKRNEEELEWANRVARVEDPTLIEKLNEKLLENINSIVDENENAPIIVAPKILEWDEAETYEVLGLGEKLELDDWPDFDDVVERFDDDVDVDFLKKCRMQVLDGDERKYGWSLFRCLSFETEIDGKKYALANANWYQIHSNFLQKIENALDKIPEFCPHKDGGAPETTQKNLEYGKCKENEFNERAALVLSGALFDRKLHSYSSVTKGSKVEPCDILSKTGHFIHVKRYKGSAPLSHLFFQGLVSATCLTEDSEFRKFLIKKAQKEHAWVADILGSDFQPAKVCAVYGIASGKGKTLLREELPIFSRIALAQSATALAAMQIPLKIWLIKK